MNTNVETGLHCWCLNDRVMCGKRVGRVAARCWNQLYVIQFDYGQRERVPAWTIRSIVEDNGGNPIERKE